MSSAIEIKAAYKNGAWVLSDAIRGGEGVRVDEAIMAVTRETSEYVQGFVISVHGLDQEVARHLDRHTLSSLGVGNYLNKVPNTGRKLKSMSLGKDGKVNLWSQR